MPTPQPAIRTQTNRVKKHILDRFLNLADKVDANETLQPDDASLYKELLLTFAKNVVPRTQEITGEDGEAINIKIVKYGDSTTLSVPTEGLPNSVT
jgi:hypothetical protein